MIGDDSKSPPPNTSSPDTIPRYAGVFLLTLSLTNLGLGIVFYISPGIVIPYWPWPVKELAVRFLGAIFLAISLGCWSAVQARTWQRAKILVLVGATFFVLTGFVSLAQTIALSNPIIADTWTGYFACAGAGCVFLLALNGWSMKQTETVGRTPGLRFSRIFFSIKTIVVGVFGMMMLLFPGVAQDQFWPWKVATPSLQTFGSLFIATCLATGWAFFQKDPKRVILLLPLDAIFPSLALVAVGVSWNVIVAESPSWLVTAVWLVLYSFVATGSTVLYIILRRGSSAPIPRA